MIKKLFLTLAAALLSVPAMATVAVPPGYTEVNAADKGVICNGTKDTGAAIQLAMNKQAANTALRLPPGKCVVSQHLMYSNKANVALLGAGASGSGATILYSTNIGTTRDDGAGGVGAYGSTNVLIGDLQVQFANPTLRGHLPKQTCFVGHPLRNVGRTTNLTIESVLAVKCKGAGVLLVNVNDAKVLSSTVDHSKADAFHSWAGNRVLFANLYATGAGDDCFASIGGSGAPNQNFTVQDSTCEDSKAGGCHFDNSMYGQCLRVTIRRIGLSCFAVSNDGLWSGNNPSDHILFEDVVGDQCVTRLPYDHGSISIYTSNKGLGPLGPDIKFVRPQIRNGTGEPGFRQWGPGDKRVILVDAKFCGLGGKPAIRVLTGTAPIQSGTTVTATCPPLEGVPPPPTPTGERGR